MLWLLSKGEMLSSCLYSLCPKPESHGNSCTHVCVCVSVCACDCVCVCVTWRGFKVPEAKPRVKMARSEESPLLGKQDKTTSPNVKTLTPCPSL